MSGMPPGRRRSRWGAVVAAGSALATLLLFPLASRVREPGPDSRPLAYALLACLLTANVIVGVRSTVAWARAVALAAGAVCALAIWQAALSAFR